MLKRSREEDLSDRRVRLAEQLSFMNRTGNLGSLCILDESFPPEYKDDMLRYSSHSVSFNALDAFFQVYQRLLKNFTAEYYRNTGRFRQVVTGEPRLWRVDVAIGVRQYSGEIWCLLQGSLWFYGRQPLLTRSSDESTVNLRMRKFSTVGTRYSVYKDLSDLQVTSLSFDERFTYLHRQDLTKDLRERLDRALGIENAFKVLDQEDLPMIIETIPDDVILVDEILALLPSAFRDSDV